jgi:hypothetical protein
VEEALYAELDALAEGGGMLGAMETMHSTRVNSGGRWLSRTKETRRFDPLDGVNTLLSPGDSSNEHKTAALVK